MATETRVWPDIAIRPGEVLAETLEARGMSQAQLARRTGRPVQAINEIVQGAKEITPETALQLKRILGVPAHVVDEAGGRLPRQLGAPREPEAQ